MNPFLATLLAFTVFSGIGSAQIVSTLTFDSDMNNAAFTGLDQNYSKITTNESQMLALPLFNLWPIQSPLRQSNVSHPFLNPYVRIRAKINDDNAASGSLYLQSLPLTQPSLLLGYCPLYDGYCETSGSGTLAEFATPGVGRLTTSVRYNRILSHENDEFLTLSFGIHF